MTDFENQGSPTRLAAATGAFFGRRARAALRQAGGHMKTFERRTRLDAADPSIGSVK
jgi:hypothetical protein